MPDGVAAITILKTGLGVVWLKRDAAQTRVRVFIFQSCDATGLP